MFKRFSMNYMVLLFLVDTVLIQSSVWLAYYLRLILPFGQEIQPEWLPRFVYVPTISMLILVAALWAASFLILSCYTPRRIIFWADEFQRITLAHTVAALSLAGLLYLANIPLLRLVFVYFYISVLILLLSFRIVLRLWHRMRPDHSKSIARILVVGTGQSGQNIVSEFTRCEWPGVELVGFLDDESPLGHEVQGLPVLGRLEHAVSIIEKHQVDEVIIALPREAHARLANLATLLYTLPVRLRVVPDYFDLAFYGATIENLGGIPLIGLRDPAIDGIQRFIKRLMDIAVSSVALLITSPIMAAVALAIKLEDNGPIFYRAPRVGENGRLFYMLKFRSMVVNADKMPFTAGTDDSAGDKASTQFHKRPDDPRITRIGRLIRRTSADELPQLINVLRGDMSVVGPRPELPWLVKEYELWQRKRFAVPQGITGWWQINGRSDNMMHLHTEQDLYYVQHYSLWLDVQILWRTIGVVLRGKGAY